VSLRDRLSRYPDGLHRLGEPAYILDTALPGPLSAVYQELDGGELFHGSLALVPSAEIERTDDGLRIGEVDGDDLYVDPNSGAVRRLEKDSGELVPEGSRFDRWLLGWVDAQEVLVDDEGEYRDDLFDEGGELEDEPACRFERKILKRDRSATGPRWRLARALARRGEVDDARRELEEVVASAPDFAWAWYDLARLGERAGDLAGAGDEMREAAATSREYAGFFWAHAARLARAAGDEAGRADAAGRAEAADPDLVRIHRDAALTCLAEADEEAAREHLELALALAPKDVVLLDMLGQLSAMG
jgi:tetratricopeptide (TPR) repeat protein